MYNKTKSVQPCHRLCEAAHRHGAAMLKKLLTFALQVGVKVLHQVAY